MKLNNIPVNQKTPAFGAIRVPVSSYDKKSFTYKTITDILELHIPINKIKISRGKTLGGQLFDYVQTSFNSLKEKAVFDNLMKHCKKVRLVNDKNFHANLARYDEELKLPQKDGFTFGFDDAESHSVREKMRESIYDRLSEVDYSKYSGGRLNEYKLDQMVKNLTQKPYIADEAMMDIVDSHGLSGVRRIQNTGYTGQMLHSHTEALPELLDVGINQVINLSYDSKQLEKACKEAGLEYHFSNIANTCLGEFAFMNEKIFCKDATAQNIDALKRVYHSQVRNYIDDVKSFVFKLNKGGYYAGCQCANNRTFNVMQVNKLINPKFNVPLPTDVKIDLSEVQLYNFYKNLTPQDKTDLGWTSEFERELQTRFANIKEV